MILFTFQYQWRSDIEIEDDIDLVDSAQLKLLKNYSIGSFERYFHLGKLWEDFLGGILCLNC